MTSWLSPGPDFIRRAQPCRRGLRVIRAAAVSLPGQCTVFCGWMISRPITVTRRTRAEGPWPRMRFTPTSGTSRDARARNGPGAVGVTHAGHATSTLGRKARCKYLQPGARRRRPDWPAAGGYRLCRRPTSPAANGVVARPVAARGAEPRAAHATGSRRPAKVERRLPSRNHVDGTPSRAFELIAHRDRRETVDEPSTSRMRNCQRCPAAITSRHVLGRYSGHVGRLPQGHLPLVQIASIGRAL